MGDHNWIQEVMLDVELYANANGLERISEALPAIQEIIAKDLAEHSLPSRKRLSQCSANFIVVSGSLKPD